MNSRQTWLALRPASLACLAVIGAALLLTGYEQERLSQARHQLQARSETRIRVAQQIEREMDDARHLEAWQQTFLQLEAGGIVGPARGQEWGDLLHNIQRDHDIPAMRYEFAPEQALYPSDRSGYAWFVSRLQLQLTIHHELDLLRSLERLQTHARALIIVRACKLAPSVSKIDGNFPRLDASCTLDWINLRREEQSR